MNTLPTNVLYDIYFPKSDGSVNLLGWSSINTRQMLSVSSATIVLPCMAMTGKSESLSVVIVDLRQMWSLRRQENDLSRPRCFQWVRQPESLAAHVYWGRKYHLHG